MSRACRRKRVPPPRLWPTLAVALAVLLPVAWAHPGLRLVDFLGFATRARRLPAADALVDPLYPVGYPLLLKATQALTGDVLLAGKVLAVAAALLAVAAAARWLGRVVGLWLLVQVGLLAFATTAGTDLGAVALMFAGLALAQRRPGLSGALLGAACLVRYTAVVGLPAGLLLAPRRGRLLAVFLVATSLHWLTALLLGESLLPDQSVNLVIGSGSAEATLVSWETLGRLPGGFGRAWHTATLGWPTMLGALGLFIGLLRRDRRAWALAVVVALHLGLVGLAFANTRLVLPATLALVLGARWLMPWWALLPLTIGLGITTLPLAVEVDTQEAQLQEAVEACVDLEGPVLATSPWVYLRDGGWLVGARPVRALGIDASTVEPEELRDRAREQGYRSVVVDPGRVRRTYPGLSDLSRERPPEGLVLVCEGGGFKGYRLDPAPPR